jgi:porin
MVCSFRAVARPLAASLALMLAAVGQGVAAAEAETPESVRPWHWSGVYKTDWLQTRTPATSVLIGNLNLAVDVDAATWLGWDDTSLHSELLWTQGGKPNQSLATTQGISNLEVAKASARLYATWIEHRFADSQTRLLFGLYDLNSEFYATDASALLIQPSFGIGVDMSQSGPNGPSIFPNLGLGLRLWQALGEGRYLRLALVDGVPGDPQQPGRTVIRLRSADGALLVGEWGWQDSDADGPQPGHWGLGAWHYTRRGGALAPDSTEHNQGAYGIAQAVLHEGSHGGAGPTTGFVRLGAAKPHLNVTGRAIDAGLLFDHPLGADGPKAITAGVAMARYSDAHRSEQAGLGQAVAGHETTLEVGARWQLRPDLALQPLLQRIWQPGGRSGQPSMVFGLRVEWSLPGN